MRISLTVGEASLDVRRLVSDCVRPTQSRADGREIMAWVRVKAWRRRRLRFCGLPARCVACGPFYGCVQTCLVEAASRRAAVRAVRAAMLRGNLLMPLFHKYRTRRVVHIRSMSQTRGGHDIPIGCVVQGVTISLAARRGMRQRGESESTLGLDERLEAGCCCHGWRRNCQACCAARR